MFPSGVAGRQDPKPDVRQQAEQPAERRVDTL